jgi:hypothetical protein
MDRRLADTEFVTGAQYMIADITTLVEEMADLLLSDDH